MSFKITQNNIIHMGVDVVVNAANTNLKMGSGVCGEIFAASGVEELQEICNRFAPIKTGEAIITKGFNLLAKYIIHTAGPIYRKNDLIQNDLLYSCYINSLNLAKANNCESIAFPLISSGSYGYPQKMALVIAKAAIEEWLLTNNMEVVLVLFDNDIFSLAQQILGHE